MGLDRGAEKLGRRRAQGGDGDAAIHLHHLAADGKLIDPAGSVKAVTPVQPSRRIGAQQAGIHRPLHKGRARIARPQRSVTIEDRDLGGEFSNRSFKRGGVENRGCI